MRQASVERNTKETQISAEVDLDGTGSYDVSSGIGFLDHMLEQLSRHSLIDLKVRAQGDLPGAREKLAASLAMHRALQVLSGHLAWVGSGCVILAASLESFWRDPRRRRHKSAWFRLTCRGTWMWWVLGGYAASSLAFNIADGLNQGHTRVLQLHSNLSV